jgi:hypothetical protein
VLLTYTIDPDARLDYTWDWSLWLAAGETIASYTLTATDITVESHSLTSPTTVTAWTSGASKTARPRPKIRCHITTTAGRQDDRTMTYVVQER